MHPGNIQVSLEPETFGRYISLDFGIVGTLTESDKEYLAQNFVAFFRRDYKRWLSCTSKAAGCRLKPASTTWSRQSVRCASRTLIVRSRKSLWAWC